MAQNHSRGGDNSKVASGKLEAKGRGKRQLSRHANGRCSMARAHWLLAENPRSQPRKGDRDAGSAKPRQVETWRHAETRGEPGDWQLTFLVSGETVRHLETQGWRLNYELIWLSVCRVTVYGGVVRASISTSGTDATKRQKDGERGQIEGDTPRIPGNRNGANTRFKVVIASVYLPYDTRTYHQLRV